MATLRDYILKNSLSRNYDIPASVKDIGGRIGTRGGDITTRHVRGVLVHRLGNPKEEQQNRSSVEFYYMTPSQYDDQLEICRGEFKVDSLIDAENPLKISANISKLECLSSSGGEFEKAKRLLEKHVLATA